MRRPEDVGQRGQDGRQELIERPFLDQQVGELEEFPDLFLLAACRGPGRIHPGHHVGDRQHHRDIDHERSPVLRGPRPTACGSEG